MALMALHHFDDEENKVSDLEQSYDEFYNAFLELHSECLTLSIQCSKQKKISLSLESKANDMIVELDQVKNSVCNKCQPHESKIVELNQIIKKYEKGQIGLKNVLSIQRY